MEKLNLPSVSELTGVMLQCCLTVFFLFNPHSCAGEPVDWLSGLGHCLFNKWADSVIMHLLEVMAIMGIPIQIKTGNAPIYVTNKVF